MVPGAHDLPLFIASGIQLNITPGPDVLYIVGRSTTQGVAAGVAAALGIGAGCFMHILTASLGLSAVLAAAVTAPCGMPIVRGHVEQRRGTRRMAS